MAGKEKYRILSLEAKDIVLENKKNEKDGFVISKNAREDLSLFLNFLDDSLDSRELKEVFVKKLRKRFSFKDDNGVLYTLAVVNVKFNYSLINDDLKMNTFKLREYLYENGFKIEGEKYVRYKRSTGSSRQGKCLFIREELLKQMEKWGECGLKYNGEFDLASWESYKSLSLSSVKGFVDIPLEGILFVKDYKAGFEDEVVCVGTSEGGLTCERKKVEISNDIWDGESLLDESCFTDMFEDKHMLLLRNKFFKSCAFKTKIQKWFRDNGITDVQQLKELGHVTLAEKVEDIVMITTPNSLKYLKFVKGGLTEENIKSWVKHVESKFGVVKYDKRTRFFEGKLVQTSYQFLNTLGFNKKEVEGILRDNIELLKNIHKDPAVLRYYFEHFVNREADIDDDIDDDDDTKIGLVGRGEVFFRLFDINDSFTETKLYDDFVNDVIENMRNVFKSGKILVKGTNATLFGNGPELLKYAVGKFDEKSELEPGKIRCEKFADGTKVLGARSPHITMGNLYLAENELKNGIWDYFDLGENIVCLNAIGENIQQRLNGCDYDSDAMLLTDDTKLVKKAEEYYNIFKVPVCNIKASGKTKLNLARMDHVASENKVGEIVNLSQRLNSLIWDKHAKGATFEELSGIYSDVCALAVLSGIEIDKAKRAYDVDCNRVLIGIREKYKEKISSKPTFFKIVDERIIQKYFEIKENKYVDYATMMDYVYALVPEMSSLRDGRAKKKNYETISSLLIPCEDKPSSTDYYHKDKILELEEEYKNELKELYRLLRVSDSDERDVLYDVMKQKQTEYEHKISDIITSICVLKLVLKYWEKNSKQDWAYYAPLFSQHNKYLEEALKSSKTKLTKLELDESGNIAIFGHKFKKTQ